MLVITCKKGDIGREKSLAMGSDLSALFLIGTAILAGTVVPGPSFVVVCRAAICSRREGLLCAFGIAAASVGFAVLALAGILAVLEAVPAVYMALKVAGGAYLCILGVRLWRNASHGLSVENADGVVATRAFIRGAVVQGSNPKAALVYASTFAAFLPVELSPFFSAYVAFEVFLIAIFWYGGVALAFASAPARNSFAKYRFVIERASGSIICAFGLTLLRREIILEQR